MKHAKKSLSILLTLCLIVGLLPWTALPARAEGNGTTEDPWKIGDSGNNVTAVLSDGVLTISGSGAMRDFDYTVSSSGNPMYIPWSKVQSGIGSVVIEDGVTSIGKDTFSWCTRLSSISIPKSVSGIGSCAFYRCDALESIAVDEDNNSFRSDDGVLFSKNGDTLYVYPTAKAGNSYTIPTSVKTVKEYAFYYSELESATIPNTVTSIESRAFQYSQIKSLTVRSGGTGTTIASYAFADCYSLVSASLDGAMNVSSQAFDLCSSLKTVRINGAATVDKSAFTVCAALKEIVITFNEAAYLAGTSVSYSADYNITINSYSDDKKVFMGWTGADDLTFTSGSADTAEVSFKMPKGSVSLTANFLKADTVAMVGETEYNNLQGAISAAGGISGGGTVTLVRDVTVDKFFYVNPQRIVTIDLNDHGILKTGGSITAYVVASGTLTLVDNAKRKTAHYIILNSDGRATEVRTSTDNIPEDAEYLTVYGGYISGGYMSSSDVGNGTGMYASGVYTLGTFVMKGGTICGNLVEADNDVPYAYGAGVYVGPEGVFTMEGGTICDNVASVLTADLDKSASAYGAGVYVDGTFIMKGGTIRDNIVLTDGEVSSNANALGGGVYVAGVLEISGNPVVSGNTEGAVKTGDGHIIDGAESNVYLPSGKTITVTKAMGTKASIGVRMEENGVFAQAADNYNNGELPNVAYFNSDAGFSIWMSEDGKGMIGAVPAVLVTNGKGSGAYVEGDPVTITAVAPAGGMRFIEWTGADGLIFTKGSATTETATFTMPARPVTLTAVWEDIPRRVDGRWDGKTLKAIVTAPDDTLLIVAVYGNNGKLEKIWTVGIENTCEKYEISTTIQKATGCTYKLMLVSKSDYVPLCAAWDSTKTK